MAVLKLNFGSGLITTSLNLGATITCILKETCGEKKEFNKPIFMNISVEKDTMEDWSIKLIDQAEDLPGVRLKESFWQHKLDTFVPNGLNERYVQTVTT